MKRYLNTTIKLNPIQGELFEEFMEFLRGSNAEMEDLGGNFAIYMQNPSKKLFKYKNCFEWISGCSYLWYNNKIVTISNYRDVPWTRIKNTPPIVKEINNN